MQYKIHVYVILTKHMMYHVFASRILYVAYEINTFLQEYKTNRFSNLWMFLSGGPSDQVFHQPVINEWTTILGIQFACITCCYVGQASDKLSGCQEQPLFENHA